MLKGYLTYICAGIGGITTGLHMAGFITTDIYNSIMGLIGAGAAYGIRRALKDAVNPTGKPE